VLRPDASHLADTLPDTPQTVLPRHFLGRPGTRAYADADPWRNTVIVTEHPEIMFADGEDPAVLAALLGAAGAAGRPVWTRLEIAEGVAAALRDATGTARTISPVRQKHAHRAPASPCPEGAGVRLLAPADAELLERADAQLNWVFDGFGGRQGMLQEGLVAAGIVQGEVVAVATTFGRSRLHADIGVHTHSDYRVRGLCTACAAALMRAILASRQTPVWTVEDGNSGSRRVSEKLGFEVFSSAAVIRPETGP